MSHPNNPNPNPNPKPNPKPKPRLARTLARTPALARILTRYHVLYLLHIGTTLFYYYSHIRSGLGLGLTLTLTLTQLTLTLTLTQTRTLTCTSARRTRWASTTATGPPASPPKHCRSSAEGTVTTLCTAFSYLAELRSAMGGGRGGLHALLTGPLVSSLLCA